MDRPYYRIWRPGTGSAYCQDKRNCRNVPELCGAYAAAENRLRRALGGRFPAARPRAVLRAQRQCVLEVQQNVYDIFRANRQPAHPRVRREELDLLLRALALDRFTVTSGALPDGGVMRPFSGEALGMWYRDTPGFFWGPPRGDASLPSLILATAGLRVLLFAQFGPLVDALIQGPERGPEDGLFARSSIFRVQPPPWTERETYRFCWEDLAREDEPFRCFPFADYRP